MEHSVTLTVLEKPARLVQTAGRVYRKPRIVLPPGYNFSICGKLIFTKKSYERTVEPAITMMQEEYFEAYSQKRYGMARWIKVRFFFIFLQILLMNMPLVSSLLELKEKLTSK